MTLGSQIVRLPFESRHITGEGHPEGFTFESVRPIRTPTNEVNPPTKRRLETFNSRLSLRLIMTLQSVLPPFGGRHINRDQYPTGNRAPESIRLLTQGSCRPRMQTEKPEAFALHY